MGETKFFILCIFAFIGMSASRSIKSLSDLEDALLYEDLKCISRHENFIVKHLLTKDNCHSLRVPDVRPKTSTRNIGERVKRHFRRKPFSSEVDPEAQHSVSKKKEGLSFWKTLRQHSGKRGNVNPERMELPLPLRVTSQEASTNVLSARERKDGESEETPRNDRSPWQQLVSPYGSDANPDSFERSDAMTQDHSQDDLEKHTNSAEGANEEGMRESEEGKGKQLDGGNTLRASMEGDDNLTFIFATLLHHAVAAGASPIVHTCLRLGADPNALNAYGETPLFAVTDKHPYLVDLLVQYGASINVRNTDLETPLYSATSSRQERVAITLITHHAADVTLTSISRFPVIAWAAQLREWNLVKTIVDVGVDVNARAMAGVPVLHIAVKGNRPDVVQSLITHGADPNILDHNWNTPLHTLVYHRFRDFEADIKDDYEEDYFYDPDVRDFRWKRFNLNSNEIARILLEGGADPRCRNRFGKTPEQAGLFLDRYKLVARIRGEPEGSSSEEILDSSYEEA